MRDVYKLTSGIYDRIFEPMNWGVFNLSMKLLAQKQVQSP